MPLDVLITGANRGLGLELTKRFLEKGAIVHVITRSEDDRIEALIEEYPDFIFDYNADVTDELQVSQALEDLRGRTDKIDILVNNAAVHLDPERIPIEEVDFSAYLRAFDVNSVSPLRVVKHALPLIRSGRRKTIVNISSEAGSLSECWRKSEYSYCMTKAALNMAGKILQNALLDDGIKVLNIHPGWFSSDMGTAEAPITPEQASIPIIETILKDYPLDGPIYVDAEGIPRSW
ncbi:MAG: SDR family NAD(P)-dependent oxidoreductase [Opitutales bacterium]|nr:SDR family NAD(P)-dependent oxidoreductase [Opitutales bacterium]